MKKYCFVCGKEKKAIFTNGFNEDTGEKNTRLVCPDSNCQASCEHVLGSRGGFLGIGSQTVCIKCGKIYDSGY